MTLVARRLTRPRANSIVTFMGVLRHYPFTGGGSLPDFRQFIEVAIEVCHGAENARRRIALERLSLILDYRGRVARGFPKLDFDQVFYQLTLRVLEPKLIDQGGYGLCGPAAFAILLAQTDPVTYIQIAVDLLLTGRSAFRNMKLKPNESICMHLPDPRTPHADWMVLASMRSSDDMITESMNRNEYGGTLFPMMIDWLKRAGYATIVGAASAHLTGFTKTFSSLPLICDIDAWCVCDFYPIKPSFLNGIAATSIANQVTNLFLADRFCRNHWNVLLLVSEKYTQTSGDVDPVEKALAPMREMGATNLEDMHAQLIPAVVGTKVNHFILVKEIHLTDNGMVRITRYSWGELETTAPISREMFYTVYGGFIAINTKGVQEAIAEWHW